MARHKPRLRRTISPRRIWMLKALGFRYSVGRDAYVLHLIGNRFGPVYRTSPEQPPSTDGSASENTPRTTSTA